MRTDREREAGNETNERDARRARAVTARLELAAPTLLGLPDDVVAAAPAGALGLGADVRFLRLAEPVDLWYAGGGAFEPETFGYPGRPVATLMDLSIEWRPTSAAKLTLYGAHAGGGAAIESIHGPGAAGSFGYLEVELRR